MRDAGHGLLPRQSSHASLEGGIGVGWGAIWGAVHWAAKRTLTRWGERVLDVRDAQHEGLELAAHPPRDLTE